MNERYSRMSHQKYLMIIIISYNNILTKMSKSLTKHIWIPTKTQVYKSNMQMMYLIKYVASVTVIDEIKNKAFSFVITVTNNKYIYLFFFCYL